MNSKKSMSLPLMSTFPVPFPRTVTSAIQYFLLPNNQTNYWLKINAYYKPLAVI